MDNKWHKNVVKGHWICITHTAPVRSASFPTNHADTSLTYQTLRPLSTFNAAYGLLPNEIQVRFQVSICPIPPWLYGDMATKDKTTFISLNSQRISTRRSVRSQVTQQLQYLCGTNAFTYEHFKLMQSFHSYCFTCYRWLHNSRHQQKNINEL